MSKTLFSHDLRVLLCDQCGAAIDVAISGGTVQCRYCNATNHLVQRDESADLAEAQAAARSNISESERVTLLRQQDHQPLMPPPSLMHLVAGDELGTGMVEHAMNEWQTTRRRLQGGAPFSEQEHLFHLTLLLTPHLDERRQRAFLETASETLPDARHRHLLRCLMAKRAVLAGDLASTESWLALCNPKPTDLQMDSGYRLACCYLAIARRQPKEVLTLLGYRFDDVPIADGLDTEAAVLRAHAYEMSGDRNSATALLQDLLFRDPWHIAPADRAIAHGKALSLCAGSYSAAREQVWTHADDKLRPKPASFLSLALPVLLSTGLLLATVYFLFAPGLDPGTRGGGGGNTGIWGLLITIGTIAWLLVARHNRKIRLHGVLTFARFVPETMEDRRGKNSTTRYCKGYIEINIGGQVFKEPRMIASETMLRPGYYPCLVLAEAPKNAPLLVEWK